MWRFATECSSWLPTAAGPFFSYALLLLGALIARRRTTLQPAGIALIFAANPFARIFTAAMGGGDEMVVAQRLAGLSERTMTLRLLTLLFVLTICGSSLVVAWQSMRSIARRALWFTVALLWPMMLTGVGLFVVGMACSAKECSPQ
jgi:formate hydrogenlyase subunit 3/multisubunit Na+/H+ antiporter MnhD subunit